MSDSTTVERVELTPDNLPSFFRKSLNRGLKGHNMKSQDFEDLTQECLLAWYSQDRDPNREHWRLIKRIALTALAKHWAAIGAEIPITGLGLEPSEWAELGLSYWDRQAWESISQEPAHLQPIPGAYIEAAKQVDASIDTRCIAGHEGRYEEHLRCTLALSKGMTLKDTARGLKISTVTLTKRISKLRRAFWFAAPENDRLELLTDSLLQGGV